MSGGWGGGAVPLVCVAREGQEGGRLPAPRLLQPRAARLHHGEACLCVALTLEVRLGCREGWGSPGHSSKDARDEAKMGGFLWEPESGLESDCTGRKPGRHLGFCWEHSGFGEP